MKLVCKNLRRTVAKGPYIFIHKTGTVRLDIGKPTEVLDEAAFAILERDGDIIEKWAPKKAKKAKKLTPPQNKMMESSEVK